MRHPIVGVCAAYERAQWSFWDGEAAIVASTYLQHLEDAGAVPLALIPAASTIDSAAQLIARVDGLLLLGGADVAPEFYGADASPQLEATVPLRDRAELALVRAALEADVPVLGICRGLHLLNVATGGTLHQDIGDLGPARHRVAPGRLDASTYHEIDIVEGSVLAGWLGAGAQAVNSHHHQAVARIGDGATIAATSREDGLVEALEWRSRSFAVGVQWHPETMALGGVIGQFSEACRGREVTPEFAQ